MLMYNSIVRPYRSRVPLYVTMLDASVSYLRIVVNIFDFLNLVCFEDRYRLPEDNGKIIYC